MIQGTADGGQTWQTISTDGMGLHQVLALVAQDDSTIRFAARTGPGCQTGAFGSFTSGEFWTSYPDTLPDFAYVNPADPNSVLSPQGVAPAPCGSVRQVQERAGAVAALCDNQLFERPAAGGAWLSLPVPGVLAIAPNDSGYTLAVSGAPDCGGISIQSLPSPIGTAPPVAMGCAAGLTSPVALTIAQLGATVWLWADDQFLVSTDSGATWGGKQ